MWQISAVTEPDLPSRDRGTMSGHLRQNDPGVDILHPLSTLQWTQCSANWPGGMVLNQAILFRNRIYVGVTARQRISNDEPGVRSRFNAVGRIYSASIDLDSWTTMPVPNVKRFSLCTYRSQLLIAGGILGSPTAARPALGRVVNLIWVSDDCTDWQQSDSVPPMPLACREPTVVNTGTPEYLLVLGGYDGNFKAVDRVDVLIDKQWLSLQPLPMPCRFLKSTLHNGNLFLTGRGVGLSCAVYCKLDSLFTACEQAKAGKLDTTTPAPLWRTLDKPKPAYTPVSFGGQLVISRRTFVLGSGTNELYAYSPLSQTWVHVGDIPENLRLVVTLVLPSGELVIIGRCYVPISRGYIVYKGAVKVCPYGPDSPFSICCLSRLEAVGIQAVTTLANVHKQLAVAAKLRTNMATHPRLNRSCLADCLKIILHLWETGSSPLPPTWRYLWQAMNSMDMEELTQQIEECLSSVDSLKEQCTSVIMAALLEQRSLEPDQLHVRLPPYVPPTVKRYITYSYKANTLQLPPPAPSPSPSPPPNKKVRSEEEMAVQPTVWQGYSI